MLSNCGPGEDSWESLDNKEIKPVNPKGKKPWIFIGRTDTEAEAPILWPPDVKSQFTGKDTDLGKTEGNRRRGCQRIRWLDSITDLMDMNLSKFQEIGKDREAWCAAVRGVSKSWTWLSEWTTVQQPTPIFLPGEFQWQRRLVHYSLRGCKELDTTEWLTVFSFSLHAFYYIICYYFYLLH